MPVPLTHLPARPRTTHAACGWFDGCTWSPASDRPGAWLGEARGGWEMEERPKAPGFASLLALLAALHAGTSAEPASVSRQRRRPCRAGLAACVGAGGH